MVSRYKLKGAVHIFTSGLGYESVIFHLGEMLNVCSVYSVYKVQLFS